MVQKSVLEIGCLSTYVVAMGEPAVPITGSRRASSRSVTASRRGSSKSVDQKVQNTLQGLDFDSVSIDVADKRILWDVTGHALPGRVLAIMGPSGEPDSIVWDLGSVTLLTWLYVVLAVGSGKTTLLNTLAGQKSIASGKITVNGQRLSKRIKRKISYVLQADIFFPNLTLRETLRVRMH